MNYLFMPLSQHFDDGFGATGEAFEQSAKLLSSNSDDVTYRFQIPLCFLYRHAIELYLKSAIVVLHRDLSIPYGKNSHAGPAFVLANKKWKPIYQVHSVAQLWEHVSYLIRSSKSELERRCKTDWQATPKDWAGWIEEIERIDGRSTFFRYPDFQRPGVDQEKSIWKPRTPDELQKSMASPGFQKFSRTGLCQRLQVCPARFPNNQFKRHNRRSPSGFHSLD